MEQKQVEYADYDINIHHSYVYCGWKTWVKRGKQQKNTTIGDDFNISGGSWRIRTSHLHNVNVAL